MALVTHSWTNIPEQESQNGDWTYNNVAEDIPLLASPLNREASDDRATLNLRGLWVAARTGQAGADKQLFATVFKKAFPIAHRALRNHEDAEEVAADCARKVLFRAKDSDPPTNVNSWVYVMALNGARDILRRRVRRPEDPLPDPQEGGREIADDHPSPEKLIDEKRYIKMLRECIGTLPEKQRQAILLCGIEQMTLKEMAEKMGLSRDNAKNHYYRGIPALRKCLKEREIRDSRNVKEDGRI